jgi:hypothetical protein
MDAPTREVALACLNKEFNVQHGKLVKNEWIIGGRIPEAYQEGTVKMFQNLIMKQAILIER